MPPRGDSDRANPVRLRTPRTLRGVELHTLTLIERPVTRRLDCAVVDEHVRATTLDLNEAEALLTVEPLDGSLCHETSPRDAEIAPRDHRTAVGRQTGQRPRKVQGR